MIEFRSVEFAYPAGPKIIEINHVKIEQSCFVAGPSGAGKSTLLSLIAGILLPTRGEIWCAGKNLAELGGAQRDQFRADHVGYIFQSFNLIPYLTARENVELPLMFSSRKRPSGKNAADWLAELGIDKSLHDKKASQLSIGQQQRVACARALIGQPEILIADEPTSALDRVARDKFLTSLLTSAEASQAVLIFVTHDETLGDHFKQRLDVQDYSPGH